MKKIILITIIIIFISGVLILIGGSVKKLHKQDSLEDKIQHLPPFSFMSLNNDSFSSTEITEGPLLIINFHPECEHCYYEISELLSSNIIESGIKLILVTYAEPDTVKRFLDRCQMQNEHNYVTLIDTALIFGDIFGSYYIPSNYLYDKKLDLIEALYGEYKTETIIKYFNLGEQYK